MKRFGFVDGINECRGGKRHWKKLKQNINKNLSLSFDCYSHSEIMN